MSGRRDELERTFTVDACERLMRSNQDYERSHGHYIVPLAELLNLTRAELAAERERADRAEKERDEALAALKDEMQWDGPGNMKVLDRLRAERDALADALRKFVETTDNRLRDGMSPEQRLAYQGLLAALSGVPTNERETVDGYDWADENDETYRALVSAIRAADESHQREGGGTTHWVREHFIPELSSRGLTIIETGEPSCPLCGHEWRRHDPEDGCCDAHSDEKLGVCECGRDMAWMHGKIAALSRAALEASADARAAALASPVVRERDTQTGSEA